MEEVIIERRRFVKIPCRRIARFFPDVFQSPFPEGSVDNMLEDMSRKAEPACREIQSRTAKSEVVGGDEPGCRVNGKKALTGLWSIQMKALFFRALKVKKNLSEDDYKNPPPEISTLNREPDQLPEADTTSFHPKLQALIKQLVSHRESISLFLSIPTSRRTVTLRNRLSEMSKSKPKFPVGSTTRKAREPTDLPGCVPLLILSPKTDRMSMSL